ncbi:hepatitis A virus cellular receptor 2 [Kogia breviceps]|uniref:hepatitis A virus cellular receptor 2 n=1 Tax=Kogia breviceps TaxID=27615 RepID=UPI0034D2485C
MFSHFSFDCVLLLLLLLTRSLKGVYVSEVGQDADLPCTYSPATPEDLVPVCWGRGPCPLFECHSLVLRTDGRNLSYWTSSRYLLKRNFREGDVTLTIKNVTLADSGTYCCRIQFPGPMNDQKSNLELVIKPAKVTPAWTAWRDITTAFPRTLTTQGPGSGYSDSKQKIQNLSLITLANLPPSGLENTAGEGTHPEENIYIIEENVYEMEDPYEYYCSVSSGQQS